MGKRRKRASEPNRQYSDEFKVEAVRLAESVGGLEASKRLGIPDSTIGNWVRLSREGRMPDLPPVGGGKRTTADLEAENHRLRQELASAKLDLEIVKKAAAYFAKESR
jgi:transposase